MSRAPQRLDIFRNYLILTSFKLLGFSACRKASRCWSAPLEHRALPGILWCLLESWLAPCASSLGEMQTLPVSDDFGLLSALVACRCGKKRCHIAEGLKKRTIFILNSLQCWMEQGVGPSCAAKQLWLLESRGQQGNLLFRFNPLCFAWPVSAMQCCSHFSPSLCGSTALGFPDLHLWVSSQVSPPPCCGLPLCCSSHQLLTPVRR